MRNAALCLLLALSCALRPSLAAGQSLAQPLVYLQQSHWTEKQGLLAPTLQNILRTPDGYLWIGSTSGLVRFDGFRFTVIDREVYAPGGRRAPKIYAEFDASHASAPARMTLGMIAPLLVDRDGVLWIGEQDGSVIRYRDGKFTRAIEPDSSVGRINALVQDRTGKYWAIGSIRDRLYVMHDSRLSRESIPAALKSSQVTNVVVDTSDGIWVGTFQGGLLHVPGVGPLVKFELPAVQTVLTPLLQAHDGTLWLSSTLTYRFRNGEFQPLVADSSMQSRSRAAVEMPDGAIVLAMRGGGLVRWKNGQLDHLRESDGLSSETVQRLLLDDDGSLWVTTDAGLDRFRATPFATIGARNGLPVASPATIQLDGDGDLWVMSGAGTGVLHKLNIEQLLLHRPAVTARAGKMKVDTFYTPLAPIKGGGVVAINNFSQLARIEAGRLQSYAMSGVPQSSDNRPATTMTARNGDIWFAFRRGGLGRVRDGHFLPIVLQGLEQRAVVAITEAANSHVFVAMADTAIVLELADDRVVRTFGREQGIVEPMQLAAAGDGDTLWSVGSQSGRLFRTSAAGTRAFALSAFAKVMVGGNPVIIPTKGELWFASSAGIGRIFSATLGADSAKSDTSNADSFKSIEMFGAADGLSAGRLSRMLFGGAVKDDSGRLWFSTLGGLAVVTPALLHRNDKAPQVLVEEVRSSGRLLSRNDTRALEIAPNPARVDINFTATSLVVPERVRIEYQLIGADTAWIDGSATRLATYTNLRPGGYEFRVRAWNEDGVPSTHDASLHFSVLPAWYQTFWFRLLAALAVMAVVFAGAAAQQRAQARRREVLLRSRFDATLEERARLAREMHDTLLSGFTGVTYQLHALQPAIVATPARAAARLTDIMSTADLVIRDARQTIWDIRNHGGGTDDLPTLLEQSAREAVVDTPIEIRVTTRGEQRALGASLDATILRVGREAVVNAVKHAAPNTISMDLAYNADNVSLHVRDDGCGFVHTDVDNALASGHLGIAGMRERANRLGGLVQVKSDVGEGTSVLLTLPAQDEVDTSGRNRRVFLQDGKQYLR